MSEGDLTTLQFIVEWLREVVNVLHVGVVGWVWHLPCCPNLGG